MPNVVRVFSLKLFDRDLFRKLRLPKGQRILEVMCNRTCMNTSQLASQLVSRQWSSGLNEWSLA